MTTVLVIGGTGLLGAPVARQLHADGHRVRLLVRHPAEIPARLNEFEYVAGDLDSPDSLRRALDGCGAVHISVRGGPTPDLYERVEHRGTARVAQLAAHAGVDRLTFVSHTLAGPDAPTADLRAKYHAEQAIVACGAPYTIFRPTYFMDTLPRQVRGRRALVLGRQPRPFHMIAAVDFARMVTRSLAVAKAAGTLLDVHGPQALTIPEALGVYREQLAPDAKIVTIPLWLMTTLDRTVLRGQLRGTLNLMRALRDHGERGDPSLTNQLLGKPTTTLQQWCNNREP